MTNEVTMTLNLSKTLRNHKFLQQKRQSKLSFPFLSELDTCDDEWKFEDGNYCFANMVRKAPRHKNKDVLTKIVTISSFRRNCTLEKYDSIKNCEGSYFLSSLIKSGDSNSNNSPPIRQPIKGCGRLRKQTRSSFSKSFAHCSGRIDIES